MKKLLSATLILMSLALAACGEAASGTASGGGAASNAGGAPEQTAVTEAETAERAALRREYIDAVTGNLRAQLDNTYIVDEQGNKRPLIKKEKEPNA